MNNPSANPSWQTNRPAPKISRRRRFRRNPASSLLTARHPLPKIWLSGLALTALVGVVLAGVAIAAAMVATALAVIVAQGLQEQAAALIPLGLSILIFTGLGALVRRWMHADRAS